MKEEDLVFIIFIGVILIVWCLSTRFMKYEKKIRIFKAGLKKHLLVRIIYSVIIASFLSVGYCFNNYEGNKLVMMIVINFVGYIIMAIIIAYLEFKTIEKSLVNK